MRLEDALRLGVDTSRAAVRGEEYAQMLADGAARLFSADAGAGISLWLLSPHGIGGQQVTTAGVRPMTAEELAAAQATAARHPSMSAMLRGPTVQRVSDTTPMEPFWDTHRIARSLGISESGVRHRLRSARDRVGAASRTELVARWAAARSDV
jgi:hypothetical protein